MLDSQLPGFDTDSATVSNNEAGRKWERGIEYRMLYAAESHVAVANGAESIQLQR